MWGALGEVLPQAIGIAISPVPIVLVILIVVSARARVNGPAFAAGWFLGVAAVAGLALALGGAADASTETGGSDGVDVVQLLLGLLFGALAVRAWRTRSQPGPGRGAAKLFGAVDSLSPLVAFGFGALSAAVNPKNTPLGLSAGGTLAQAGLSGGEAVVTLAIYAVLASATVLVPVAAVMVMGERSREPLERTKQWLLDNNSTIMMVLFVVLAAKMIGQGLGAAG